MELKPVELTEDQKENLEIYSKNQTAIDELLKRDDKYSILEELAQQYGELAHEVNNKQDIEDITDPGTVAIAVQLILSSFKVLEKEALK